MALKIKKEMEYPTGRWMKILLLITYKCFNWEGFVFNITDDYVKDLMRTDLILPERWLKYAMDFIVFHLFFSTVLIMISLRIIKFIF